MFIQIYVWGPTRSPTMGGANYFLAVIDHHSREVWIMLLKSRLSSWFFHELEDSGRKSNMNVSEEIEN